LLLFYFSSVYDAACGVGEETSSAGFLIREALGFGEAISDITILRCLIIEGGDSIKNSFALVLKLS
jgi:hypothetical protein